MSLTKILHKLSIQQKSVLSGSYIPKKYKDVVHHFMINIHKESNMQSYPLWINGIVILWIDDFYYAIYSEILKLMKKWDKTTFKRILIELTRLLAQEQEWNAPIIMNISMNVYCVYVFISFISNIYRK